MSLFPMIQPRVADISVNTGLYIEVAWDYEKNAPIYKDGEPVTVSGKDAVLVWAWNALHTPRYRYEIFTSNYGNEVESLVGRPFSDDLKQSEASRHVKECLLINPYITGVRNIAVSFLGSRIEISCVIDTIYGEVSLSV